jgi:hypothetical protein
MAEQFAESTATALSIVFALLSLLTLLAILVGCVLALAKLVSTFSARGASTESADAREPTYAHAATTTALAGGRHSARPNARSRTGTGQAREFDGAMESLVVWRYREFLRLHVDPVAAAEASLLGIDASGVRSLIERGCDPTVALRIRAPDIRCREPGSDDGGSR